MTSSEPHPSRIPVAAWLLGSGGLVPFWVLAILVATGTDERIGWPVEGARTALATYGAVIASFLGGIRWGVALREEGPALAADLALSVVPALVAWACLAAPGAIRLVALAALIAAWGAIDQDLQRRGLAPPWFGRLRGVLSAGAAAALALGALG